MKKLNEIISENYKPKLKALTWLTAAAAVVTISAYAFWPAGPNRNYEPGEILLKLKSNAVITQTQDLDKGVLGVPSIDKLNKEYGATWAEKVFDTVSEGDASRVYQLELPHNADIEKIIKEYAADSNVEYAEPDYQIKLGPMPEKKKGTWDFLKDLFKKQGKQSGIIPNDPGFSKQWGLAKINAPEAWQKQKGDSNIVIAIVDTGVDYNHEDLKAEIFRDKNGKVIGWNFVKNSDNPMDGNGHGTHCAGIAAASTDNKKGGAGVAWNSKIMPVKVLNDRGSGYTENLADGILYAADKGAHVISNSWGGPFPTKTIHEAIKYAYSKGAIIVAAAGNNGTDRSFYPAAYPEVISVAATDKNDKKASFSNYGKTVNVSAPGVNIYSTVPKNGYDGSYSGTSMACPYASGVIALMLSENPKLDTKSIRDILGESGDKKDSKIPPRINLEKAIEHVRQK